MDKQIYEFYEQKKMSDISSRIRFFACEQIELAISGMFPQAEVLPFGSSVNTFGQRSSDLDMFVTLDGSNSAPIDVETETTSSRLIFHAKGCGSGGQRVRVQRYCDQFFSLIGAFLPGCQNLQNLSHARVPIIKYNQQLLGLECDLSLTSMSGIYMSEMLYIFGELDQRVRPLVFMVRHWAKHHGLIENYRPTNYFTNFGLTVMVVFFLQYQHNMLPSFGLLHHLADPKSDHRISNDGVDCTFLRDISGQHARLNAKFNQPDPSVSELLLQFFDFYAKFDFDKKAVCILSGKPQPKRNKSNVKNVRFHIDLTNPLEPDLNVCANVHLDAVGLFQMQCKKSHSMLADLMENNTNPRLMDLFRGDALPKSMKVKIADLGWESSENSTKPVEITERTSQKKDGENSLSEQKRLNDLKKRSRVEPKVRNYFAPKF
jgi:poly(A) RNA polymerase